MLIVFVASLTAFANAAGPLAHPFFRHGALPVSPFYPMLHPGMFPWPPVPAPGIPALAPNSTEISSTATTGPKSEVQVNRHDEAGFRGLLEFIQGCVY